MLTKRTCFTLLLMACLQLAVPAQLVIDNTVDATGGVQDVLLGGGITATNISFQGANEQIASFTCNSCGVGLGYGVVIASGNANGAVGTNNSGSYSLGPPTGSDGVSDPDLVELSGMSLNNTAVLEFDFVPTGDSLFFNYVFGSDEYPEFVNSINDAFGFFLSGPGITGPYTGNAANIALIPGTSVPISINTVNNLENSTYYVSNTGGGANIQADGFTTVLTAIAEVICGETYHIKIAVGDAMDGLYDSWVYLEAGSFQSNQLAAQYTTAGYFAANNGGVYEGCDYADITFTRSGDLDSELTYDLTYLGTAGFGVDYDPLPEEITFAIGEESVTVSLLALSDAVLEGEETLIINVEGQGCNTAASLLNIVINDLPAIEVDLAEALINCGQEAVFEPVISGGLGNYHIVWEDGTPGPYFSDYPAGPTTYEFTITDTCGVEPYLGNAVVNFIQNPPLVVDIGNDITATCLDQIDLIPDVSGGFGSYSYAWYVDGSFVTSNPDLNFQEDSDLQVEVVVTDDCNVEASDIIDVTYPPVPVLVELGSNYTVTCLDQTLLEPVASGGVGNLSFSWSSPQQNYGSGSDLLVQVDENTTITILASDQCGNEASDFVNFTVPPSPVNVDLGNDLTVTCLDESVLSADVSGGVGSYSYQWSSASGSLGNNDQILFQTISDADIVLVVTDQCGNQDQDIISIAVPQVAVNTEIGDDLVTTCIDPVTITSAPSGGIGTYSYTWYINGVYAGNQPSLTHVYPENSLVEVVMEDQCGNSITDALSVNVPPVPVTVLAGDDVSATCVESVELQAQMEGGVGNYSVSWSDPESEFSSNAHAFYTAQNAVTLNVTVTDQCGNTDSDQLNIAIPPVPVYVETSSDTTICKNEMVSLTGSATGGAGVITTYWEELSGSESVLAVAPEMTSSYTFYAMDQCGNTASSSVVVQVTDVNPNFVASYVDDFTIAFENLTMDADYVVWEFSDGSVSTEDNPVHSFQSLEDWYVTLTAYSEGSCRKSIVQEYYPSGGIYVPNTFTPDNDGINDVFFAYGHDIVSFEMSIYNRYGEVIFESSDMTKPWDGSVHGGNYYSPDGVYTYQIKAVDKRDLVIEKKGMVQILR